MIRSHVALFEYQCAAWLFVLLFEVECNCESICGRFFEELFDDDILEVVGHGDFELAQLVERHLILVEIKEDGELYEILFFLVHLS